MKSSQDTTFIYSIEDENGNIRYIGKSNNPNNRIYKHLKEKYNLHKYNWLHSIINRGFFPIVKILEEVPLKNWEVYEVNYIKKYKELGYDLVNISEGGCGRNSKHKESSKKIMSKSKIGISLSESHREKISSSVKDKFQSEPNYNKCRDKIHIIDKDLLYQKYIVENLSLNKCSSFFNISKCTIFRNVKEYGFKKSREDWEHQLSTKKKSEIIQYDLEGNFIKEWVGASTIEKELGYDNGLIINCCEGRQSKSNGFIWRYKDDKMILRKINSNKNPLSVIQIKDNVIINKFKSISEASRLTKIQRSSIAYCCKGKLKSSGGYIWKYENNI